MGETKHVVADTPERRERLLKLAVRETELAADTETDCLEAWGKQAPILYPHLASLAGFSVYLPTARLAAYVPVQHSDFSWPQREARRYFAKLLRGKTVYWWNLLYDAAVLLRLSSSPLPKSWHDGLCFAALEGRTDFRPNGLKGYVAAEGLFPKTDVFKDVTGGKGASTLPVAALALYASRDAEYTYVASKHAWSRLDKQQRAIYTEQKRPLYDVVFDMCRRGIPFDSKRARDAAEAASRRMRDIEAEWRATLTHPEARAYPPKPASKVAKERKELYAPYLYCRVTWKDGKARPYAKGRVYGQEPYGDEPQVNMTSDPQLAEYYYGLTGLWPTSFPSITGPRDVAKNADGSYSCKAYYLKKWVNLRDPFDDEPTEGSLAAQAVLNHRYYAKSVGTFFLPMVQKVSLYGDGRLRTSINITGTKSGRFSSNGPNLQNLPSKTATDALDPRSAVRAPDGRLLVVYDYSQLEYRLMASIAQDEALMDVFRRGEDVHTVMQHRVGAPDRNAAKTIVYGILYGMGPDKLGDAIGVSPEAAKGYIEQLVDPDQPLGAWQERQLASALEKGYVETIRGHRRYLAFEEPQYKCKKGSERWWRANWRAKNRAINHPIQGSAADVINYAMLNIDRALKKHFGGTAWLLLQVHDELMVECDAVDAERVGKCMKYFMEKAGRDLGVAVPLSVEGGHGTSWVEAK